MKKLKVTIDSHTIAGTKPENQDACAYHLPDTKSLEYKGVAVVIADGVSACTRAREASSCCVSGFLSDYYSTPDSWSVEHSATKVISALNNWLYSQSIRSDEVSSMLSTLSVIIVKSNIAHVFHVGDSRIYRFRSGVLTQLTNDHILSLNKEKTYLSRAMGFDLRINVDYQTFDLEQGDQFLMTTDGVHDYLDDALLEILMSRSVKADDIVSRALDSGSIDNITAVIATIQQLPEKNLDEAFDELTQRPVPPDLNKGMKINGFEVQSMLISSAKMQLYKAKDIATGQIVALKTPSINFEDDAQYLKHFMYEKWVGQRVQSPHVVKIHNSDEQSTFLAYAMEYIKGQTLRQWIDNNPNPDVEIVVSYVKQIIQGVRAFHRQEMLHCDLKPENIMIDELGQIKIIDFGSARIAGVSELVSPINSVGNQGTQGYTAPEVILDEHVSQASDQFSLGAIVYEIFASTLVYQDKLDKDLSVKKLSKLKYESTLMHNPNLPVWIDGAIRKACSLDVTDRYEVLSEFLYDLEHPNPKFLSIQKIKQPESKLSNYRFWLALSFTSNFVFLLLLIVK
ncbi:Nitrite transporter-associated serine/threonine protein kinase [uncultured Gammaproteobacteria bacterium]|uniref:bifunctional protein-serine/threonine kinase/phosphatase n=1 Tax=Bathymodiolus heckerae thiotrophic gill symbiont TaxID=1052212 RepID=UPI0010B76238|nr:bifunctional protein-serine/threonine kinase/phosphatase [Bathymodiolus heckerae thiotrophic gill symbiont]CAC9592765.1 Nitrite transporter-associated serine/threonine protein kinase [uncultured Gammaproteobacteria bacterium]CAC9600902.1 Nitrite transporter-associated serine/threonine protein kinase [uncultured Gammaproteobacteria bacterium]CAC9607978.1 Nitrite transporter-associated serine/threonine protein kinase [uncultured Gammaproteobacteria bacterium]CAC9960725.1 Nitrite transporter-as